MALEIDRPNKTVKLTLDGSINPREFAQEISQLTDDELIVLMKGLAKVYDEVCALGKIVLRDQLLRAALAEVPIKRVH